MKLNKMLEQLGALLSEETRTIVEKKKTIKNLLKQLKQEKRQLNAELEMEQDSDKARQLRRKLKIVKFERKKGIRILKTAMNHHSE